MIETHEFAELLAMIEDLKARVLALEASDVPITQSRPSQEEVVEFCKSRNLLETDSIWFYSKMLGSGWKNNGKPVRSWRATITAWDIAKIFPSQKINGTATVFGLKAALEAKKEQAQTLQNRYAHQAAMGWSWSDEKARQQFIQLKHDIKDLNARIAASA